ncbi:MAG: PH domain-containing protein [Acidimicrobiales bacterium]
MTFSRRAIHEDEEVLLEARPHWSLLVGPSVVATVVLAGSVAIYVTWSAAPRWFDWVLLGVTVVAVCRFLARLVGWRSTDLVVTTMRVIYRRGVVRRSGREILISSIQDVSYVQTLLERMIGKGELSVQSAGGRGEPPFENVRHPAVVQGLINRTIEESRRHDSGGDAEVGPVAVADELERLSKLHRRGVITDAEYVRLKEELVAGSDEDAAELDADF